jgi:hypothetical protein
MYFVVSLIYRFALGYYVAVKNEYLMSSLIVVGFSLFFLLYNLVNLPFKQAYQNYRANFCHVSQLIILMVTNYYDSMTANDHWETKAYEFNPAKFQIAAIYITAIISAACLAYDGYVMIKLKFLQKPQPVKSKPRNALKDILPNY